MRCGLLGRMLAHSYSPAIHSRFGNYEYCLFEKEPEQLQAFLQSNEFDGLNVTIPYKTAVIPYLDELTPVAKAVGSVNTIFRRNGALVGHNTDFAGFQHMLKKSKLDPRGKKCLVLGSGGASKVVIRVLEGAGAQVVVISRSGENHYGNLSMHKDAAIIVNTTPVGMYPHVGVSPVDLDLFFQLEGVLDIIYNPARTALLLDASRRGILTMDGLWMLVCQAAEASTVMTGTPITEEKMVEVYGILRRQMKNIILIGMPGCGKTSVGQLVAAKTGHVFLDADAEIEKLAQKSIARILNEDGEDAFRKLESRVLSELGKQSGLVIATGGGCVTRPQNASYLHQNGVCFWLRRHIQKLSTEGRPLSVNLEAMWKLRQPMYAGFADVMIDNNGSPQVAADEIVAYWEEMT